MSSSSKPDTSMTNMEQEEIQVITLCKEFSEKADELETKAFGDCEYKETKFNNDFDTLFQQNAYGNQNGTVSGLNFRYPPRYSHVKEAVHIEGLKVHKLKYEVFFWANRSFNSIKFIVQRKQEQWKLIKFQTCLTTNPNKRECRWRSHKL